MLRDYGDAVEASLAYQGIDLRDLYRPGSGMTLRRLNVLLRALPAEAPLWAVLEAAQTAAMKATPDEIRDRQAQWKARNEARRQREAS